MTQIIRDEAINKLDTHKYELVDNKQISLVEHNKKISELHKLVDQLKNENSMLYSKLDELQKELSESTESQYQSAKQEGYKTGFNEGLEKSKQEFSDLNDTLSECCILFKDKVLKDIETHKYALFTILQSSLVKILGKAYSESETIISLITEAIQTVDSQHELVVYLHKYDYNRVKHYSSEIQAKVKPIKLSFATDDSLKTGGCILKSRYQGWDAQLDNQLSNLLESISFLFNDK
ncbi:FliH/SctL family protein [Zooshikella sp. RANM57]|uniref:FliH/SctL family protein n=1 Tax=Zooshikella sp. RANM57 TaxID=3425863 RepID=UPI003D6E7FC1